VSAALTVERQFRLAWPRWQPPPGGGIIALVAQSDATLGWADALLARDSAGLYVWASRGAEPERRALEILELPEVRAATLVPDGADARQVGLGLEFATWLARERAGVGFLERPSGACLTSWSKPTPPPGTVRVPHLVTVRHATEVADAVVWELATSMAARRWLGCPLAIQHSVEAHLDGLLRLRAAARARRLPPTAAAARLSCLLGERDLSIELVYQRFDLFRVLLGGRPRVR
jgi:hypothetical protein